VPPFHRSDESYRIDKAPANRLFRAPPGNKKHCRGAHVVERGQRLTFGDQPKTAPGPRFSRAICAVPVMRTRRRPPPIGASSNPAWRSASRRPRSLASPAIRPIASLTAPSDATTHRHRERCGVRDPVRKDPGRAPSLPARRNRGRLRRSACLRNSGPPARTRRP
jgi:hypothetical protein